MALEGKIPVEEVRRLKEDLGKRLTANIAENEKLHEESFELMRKCPHENIKQHAIYLWKDVCCDCGSAWDR